ncbi:MAG TPA: MAE_28990/MAE_18760 family HEPN-like nuclease [Pseudomonas sp.]|nr:MAE_28990/MAE_18760 family HEPN-like nuclease [Pseudomonas sp.]
MSRLQLEEIASQLEIESTWRRTEYTQVKNALYSNSSREEDKESFNKSLILLLYSNYEGFCKSAFAIYIEGINSLHLKRKEVKSTIRASSLQPVFDAYDQLDRKGKFFRNTLPDDTALHRLCRRTEFIDSMSDLNEAIVKLDPDKITDAESNLKPHILKKILYKSGLNAESVNNYEPLLSKVVNIRNAIAHGAQRGGIKPADFINYENAIHQTEECIKNIILKAVELAEYLENA